MLLRWSALTPLVSLFVASELYAAPAQARAIEVVHQTTIHTESWMPIAELDLAAVLRDHVVSQLSSTGVLRLSKLQRHPMSGRMLTDKAEMLLDLQGDVIGEAGTFTVSITLRPIGARTLPSFAAAATATIARVPKHVMYTRIVAAVKEATVRLERGLRSGVGLLQEASSSGSLSVAASGLFRWPKLSAPPKRAIGADARSFSRAREDRSRRIEAGMRLASLAYDSADVRHLIEHVLLSDTDPVIRLYALRFLEPASRRHRFTQHVVLNIARNDGDPKVRGQAFELSPAFLSSSPAQTLQTWVELLAARPAEFAGHAKLVKLLVARPDLPNLDLALSRCLAQRSVMAARDRQRKQACLSIARELPAARRTRLMMSYVDRPSASFGHRRDSYGPYGSAVRQALEGGCSSVHAAQRALIQRAEQGKDAQQKRTVLDSMSKGYPFPEVSAYYRRELLSSRDREVMFAALSALESIRYQHYPPWAVLSWDLAARTLAELSREGGLEQRLGGERAFVVRNLRARSQSGYRSVQQFNQRQRHRLALKPHLSVDEQPAASALPYFVSCVQTTAGREQTDCATGIHWLALYHKPYRQAALSAALALLRQKQVRLERHARQVLLKVQQHLTQLYREGRIRYPGNLSAKCEATP
jgi:hypothetical protein